MSADGDFVNIHETVARLHRDLEDLADFARITVMARDLRVALAWIERNADFIEGAPKSTAGRLSAAEILDRFKK